MAHDQIEVMRKQIDEINLEILELINKRAALVQEVGKEKEKQGSNRFDPERERQMLNLLVENNKGPFNDSTVRHLFKQIFQVSLDLQNDEKKKVLLVSRKKKAEDTVITVKGVEFGGSNPILIAGPCSVESYEQVRAVAQNHVQRGLRTLRGGAYKPRTSPYDFQGLGEEGLQILKRIGDEFNLVTISEIVTPGDLEMASQYIDVIQIGARNMQNFELLKAAGRVNKPILLKRGLAATIEEFIYAAEYILSEGNTQVMLCERGIRTYEKATRNTLDISAVPLLKQETHLPVFVDVTHSTGRRDLLLPCAKAGIAVGSDGIMVEVHPDPDVALSDAKQQLNIPQFNEFVDELIASGLYKGEAVASRG
ncbi:bifunctional 3-deoxy-7-phosphoheptulonate synthase/chorismate mutase [Brevibacillus reuszeri]|uniref:bifunctional 3-deoxy-7-phosphoheptulonate synthase/chorismate mutase n=1 Tax=Brevibacillus reuszeri TaxID=54915 RepID=UPI001B00850C|nr:bifunctional 3-deoxy-7-phosphoheptulonate synthase/chorismate mutase [Brevibacillus reuszeri]GIO08997.1 bifunctional 3-deoxy-7-phosphoheptulonate synthase/chorismate mutase [Brevibacillus reuszeri]